MKVITRGDAFFIYTFPSTNVEHVHMKFLPRPKNSRMCLKRKMKTPYLNIDHMIALLILCNEHNLHLNPSTICHKMNLQWFANTSMKTLKNGSFDILSLQLVP
jgi:hypothetical protein